MLNCSPDIREQIVATTALQPNQQYNRHSPLGAIVLTNGDVDHIAGLLTLREKQRFNIFATPAILEVLDQNPIFNVLDSEFVSRNAVELGDEIEVMPGLRIELFSVPGKVALYLEQDVSGGFSEAEVGRETEDTVGVKLHSAGDHRVAYYIPGCAMMTDTLHSRLQQSELVFFDGTVWHNEEMIDHGTGLKTGQRMGHMSMAGDAGSMCAFDDIDVKRKVYVHINNTNPVLIDGSQERKDVEQNGWTIAYDGMELAL